uniref:Uncharacterized protein n=1 Tax=Arundo donax TaxID=35708 RepID=A0A0A9BYF8_ARUDO
MAVWMLLWGFLISYGERTNDTLVSAIWKAENTNRIGIGSCDVPLPWVAWA